MGVPKICLYMTLLNVNTVESIMKFNALIHCSRGIFVFCAIRFHLFFKLSITRSKRTFVKSETTSRDAKVCWESRTLPSSWLTDDKNF